MKAVLIDDEPYALQGLKRILDDFCFIQVVGMFTSTTQALQNIEALSPDIVFLDIEMPGIAGIELYSIIKDKLNNVKIVFTTAYSQYAVKAYELYAIDYIVKPVEKERLKKTFERLKITDPTQKDLNANPITINCFGQLTVIVNGKTISVGARKKAEELIAYLVCYKNEFIPKEKIMYDLWPDLDKDKAQNNFNVNLNNIRKLASGNGFSPIESYSGRIRICMDYIDCDLCKFEKLTSLCRLVDTNTINAAVEAVEMYKGMLFESNYYPWAAMHQAKFDVMYLDLLDRVIDYYSRKNNMRKVKYFEAKRSGT